MSEQTEKVPKSWRRVLAVTGLLLTGSAGYWVQQNYDIRVVRLDAAGSDLRLAELNSEINDSPMHDAANAPTDRPPPIIVQLACVDAGAALRSVRSPNRLLRQSSKRGSSAAPAPQPEKRCKPDAAALADVRDGATVEPVASVIP